MTHPAFRVDQALDLRSSGLSASQIAERLEIPRETVRDWVGGRVPRSYVSGQAGCQQCGHPEHRFAELPLSYTYLLGLYLGDGSIATHHRGVNRLRITLDSKYPGIVGEAAAAVREVLPRSRVGLLKRPSHDVEVSSYSRAWPCLFPQHGPGKKHLRRIELIEWQGRLVRRAPHLLLRGLIHSDGCRFMNTGRGWRHPRYSFSNLSPEIRRIFTDACDLLGIRWTASGRTVYVSRKADVSNMDQFIGPKA